MSRKCELTIVFAIVFALIFGCSNPNDSGSIPADLGIGFSASRISDDANAFVFFPIEFRLTLGQRNYARHIDSVLVITTSESRAMPTTHRMNLDELAVSIAFADTGSHQVTMRIFEYRNDGAFYDSVLTIRAIADYAGIGVDATIGRNGSDVILRATGSKYEGVEWVWDLTDVGLGVIRSAADTARVFVPEEVSGEVYLYQAVGDRAGEQSPRMAVPFVARQHVVGEVTLGVSRVNADMDVYVGHPVTISADIRSQDIGFIDSVVLSVPRAASGSRVILSPSNDFSGEAIFSDSGRYTVEARIFGMMGGELPFRDTTLVVRVGVVGDVSIAVSSVVGQPFDGYIFAPINLSANIRQSDRGYVDSIVVVLPEGAAIERRLTLLPATNFAGSATFVDTGSFRSSVHIFGATGGTYRAAEFTAVIGVDFGVGGDLAAIEVDDVGGDVLLRAVGHRPEGVQWEWGLSRVNLTFGDRRVLTDTTTVRFAGGVRSDTIYLSQVLTHGGVEYTFRRGFRYTTALKRYLVSIDVFGELGEKQGLSAKRYRIGTSSNFVNLSGARSFEVVSGTDVRSLEYDFVAELGREGGGMWTPYGNVRLDSVFINDVSLPIVSSMGGVDIAPGVSGGSPTGVFDVGVVRSDVNIRVYGGYPLSVIFVWPEYIISGTRYTRGLRDNKRNVDQWSHIVNGLSWVDCDSLRHVVFYTTKRIKRDIVWEFVYNDLGVERTVERIFAEGGIVADKGGLAGDGTNPGTAFGIGKLWGGEIGYEHYAQYLGHPMEAYIIPFTPDNSSLVRINMRFVCESGYSEIVGTLYVSEWLPRPAPQVGGCRAPLSNFYYGMQLWDPTLTGENMYNFTEITP